jgi:hypothetical protein
MSKSEEKMRFPRIGYSGTHKKQVQKIPFSLSAGRAVLNTIPIDS